MYFRVRRPSVSTPAAARLRPAPGRRACARPRAGKKILALLLAFLFLPAFCLPALAEGNGGDPFDTGAQLDALGRDELMDSVPEEARELMEESGVYDLSVSNLLHLSPREFFRAVWNAFVRQLGAPARTLGSILGIILLCLLLNGVRQAAWDGALTQVFGTVSVLCVVLSVAKPILDCIAATTQAIRDASFFMASFVPVFSAALMASGQPATGAAYNVYLFSACQVVGQAASQTLVPLLSAYLALCIVGALVPEINIASAAAMVKNVASWALGLICTLFIALLSVQTLVSTGADSATTKTAKFMLGSFVPVVGGALSEAFSAAQGCLRLIKTSVGVYGIVAAIFTFLPVLLNAIVWYAVANLGVVVGDIAGVPAVATVLKACSAVLGILIAIILCYALLLIVSTAIVLATGTGVA